MNIICRIIGHRVEISQNIFSDRKCKNCKYVLKGLILPTPPTRPPKIIEPIPLEWEQIDSYHQRSKTIGGWLFKTFEEVTHFYNDGYNQQGYDIRVAITFIPDPNHEWLIK